MGQAQLLLIVLGVVLVGIAIIAGIQAYTANNVKASLDAQVHDQMRIASDLQTWVQKPAQFGGPLVYANFAEVTDFSTINYKNSDGTNATNPWTNVNADYQMTVGADITVASVNDDLQTYTALAVCGINDSDIFIETATDAPPAAPVCP